MKKTLLSMAAMLLLATGVNAQKFDAKVAKMADLAKLANRNKVELNVASTSKHNVMKKEGEEDPQYTLVGYQPATSPVGYEGWPTVEDAMGVAAQMPVDETAYGYKVVGVRFAVVGSLGVSPDDEHPVGAFVYAMPSDENATDYAAFGGVNLPEGSYQVSSLDGQNLELQWNDVAITPFTIDDTMSALMWGVYYVQNTDADSQDATPFLYGEYEDASEFPDYKEGFCPYLVLGSFGTGGFSWYLNATEDYPYAVCMMAICELPNGSTAVIGLNGSKKPVAQQYYTVDGKRLSAPQKGLNIVKLSNGETQKVYVK